MFRIHACNNWNRYKGLKKPRCLAGLGCTMCILKYSVNDSLRLPQFRNNPNKLAGHCYVISEVARYFLGSYYHPMYIKHENVSHWFLKGEDGQIVDLTKSQFKTKVPYHKARGNGFLTKELSKRATLLRDRVWENL